MSFRCGICNEPQPERTKPIKIVLETRKATYPERRGMVGRAPFRREVVIDNGGGGWEIAEEVDACVVCAEKYKERYG